MREKETNKEENRKMETDNSGEGRRINDDDRRERGSKSTQGTKKYREHKMDNFRGLLLY